MNKPLEGLFVVELTTYWAAPSAGEFLRCLGARVVKIETGKAGDSVRYWGRTCGMPIEANENPSFDLFNGGKEFMHMDLNDPEHERVLHNMLAKADVFLTSMRLGGLKKHNLDYDTLKEKYPRLVMAHATGYGCKDGPLSAAPGLDAVAFFAMNGLISDLRLNPDDSPICPPTGMGDLTTGMPLFGAIMTALFARERTGKGDYVSASLYGTGNWVTSAINSGTQYFNPWPRSRFTQSPMGQAFETKDGKFVQIFVNEYERYFPIFCKAFNIEDMLDDERVNTRPALNVNGNCAIIVARCIEEAKKKTADEIMSVLQAGNVPCTVLRGIGDKYKEQEQLDQCLSNGYLGEGTAYFYSKYYLEDMLEHYADTMPLEDTYTHYLDRLMDDNNSVCSNIKLLYYFLCSERNISLTAKHVHMHRNSVIYRIQKIQDILALDLDDPDVRLRLMISFKILEMTGRIPHWETPHGENDTGNSGIVHQE